MNRRRFFALIGAAIAGKKLAPAYSTVPPHLRVSDAVMSLPSGGAGLFNPVALSARQGGKSMAAMEYILSLPPGSRVVAYGKNRAMGKSTWADLCKERGIHLQLLPSIRST